LIKSKWLNEAHIVPFHLLKGKLLEIFLLIFKVIVYGHLKKNEQLLFQQLF
jgi:hypothetical protein